MTYQKQRFETYIGIGEMLEKYFDYKATSAKCRACPGFASTWSCPEFDFSPEDYWKDFLLFHLIVEKVYNQGSCSPDEAQERLSIEKALFNAKMLLKETQFPGSTALVAQECIHCKRCARLMNKPCTHPEIMRYALESLGMLAVNLVKDKFGFELLWSDGKSIPEYYLLVGGILLKKDCHI